MFHGDFPLEILEQHHPEGLALLVCSPDVQRKVQATVQAAGLGLQMLSTSDINPDFPLQRLGTVGL